MARTILLSLILLVIPAVSAFSQNEASEKIRPQWMHRLPEATNPTFKYEIRTAIAPTLDEARSKCFAELVSDSGLKTGTIISSDNHSRETLSQKWVNGALQETIDYTRRTDVHARQAEETLLYVQNAAEYWERNNSGEYVLSRLYAVSQLNMAPLFDNIRLTTDYGARALWRSAIFPGWGQLHKGQKLKGGLILGSCTAIVGGIIASENMRSDYYRKFSETHNTEQKKFYADRVDMLAMTRNICIGATCALYIYNLIDSVVSPGARRIVVYPASPDRQSIGMAISMKF